jgi:hypothetical protein
MEGKWQAGGATAEESLCGNKFAWACPIVNLAELATEVRGPLHFIVWKGLSRHLLGGHGNGR